MDDYEFNSGDYESYGQSYAPGSWQDQLNLTQPKYDYTPVDFNNMPSYDPTPTQPTQMPDQGLGDLWGAGNNYGFSKDPGLVTNDYMPQSYGQSTTILPQVQDTGGINWGAGLGSVGGFLSNLFNGLGDNKGNTGKLLSTGLAAYLAGRQNKQLASSIPGLVQQQQQYSAPFDAAGGATAGSPRAAMQQQLQQAIANPYGQKIVSDQVEAIRSAQAAKDAAAGRRSNTATSSPAMLAAQAQVAQNYINSLYNPAGANIAPNGQYGLQALMQANNANVAGYASPLMQALGYGVNTTNNTQAINNLIQALRGQ